MKKVLTDYTIETIRNGYIQTEKGYICIICQKSFMKNEIFKINGRFFNAEEKVINHIETNHDGVIGYLLSLEKKQTGLSTVQRNFIENCMEGMSDKDTAKALGISPSAVRFHRYTLKEKAKQAKLYLALYDMIESDISSSRTSSDESLIHDTATMVDERFFPDSAEINKVIKNNLESTDPLVIRNFPAKEKKKLIILNMIAGYFSKDRKYTEKEVNEILSPMYHDHVTIRRYLIEYGYMARTRDCSTYWIK